MMHRQPGKHMIYRQFWYIPEIIAKWQFEKSNNQKNTDFVEKTSTFEFQKNALQARWISRTIYDWHFSNNINPTWETWINR